MSVCWLNEDCIAGEKHTGPCRFPSFPDYDDQRFAALQAEVDRLRLGIEQAIADPEPHYDSLGFPDGYAVPVKTLQRLLEGQE